MAYEYRYINRQVLGTGIVYTLIIENETENYRMEKCFKLSENLIDREFLRIEAKKEIDRIEQEKLSPITQEMEEDNGSID